MQLRHKTKIDLIHFLNTHSCSYWNDFMSAHYLKEFYIFCVCLQNPKTAAAVRSMVKDKAMSELQRCFGARMEFGTAGLRAAMGPGVSCMNDLTIIQTTQVT